VFNHYGPFVYDVLDTAKDDPAFEVVSTRNMYGAPKDLLRVADDVSYPSLEEDEREVLDFVLEGAVGKNWDDFMRLVYSTYPIVARERFTKLDLIELASEYREVMPLLESGR
jgi:predicted nucleic acid-binding OB-fold protein